MSRSAWNACRSCSPLGLSKCADSFASTARAGVHLLARSRPGTRSTGCWVSQSTSTSGRRARSARAMPGRAARARARSARRGTARAAAGVAVGRSRSGRWAAR